MFLVENERTGLEHTNTLCAVLSNFSFEENVKDDFLGMELDGHRVVKEPIGVCGLITPWNWPANQIVLKTVAALGAGCTVVLKPSELAPMSAMMLASFFDQAGLPAGVFNLVNGDGLSVGQGMFYGCVCVCVYRSIYLNLFV